MIHPPIQSLESFNLNDSLQRKRLAPRPILVPFYLGSDAGWFAHYMRHVAALIRLQAVPGKPFRQSLGVPRRLADINIV